MKFEDWLGEIESFSLRGERAFEELVKWPEREPADQWENIREWLEAAYKVGLEEGQGR